MTAALPHRSLRARVLSLSALASLVLTFTPAVWAQVTVEEHIPVPPPGSGLQQPTRDPSFPVQGTRVTPGAFSLFPFSFATPGARSLGMGGAFLGFADDATAASENPAGLVQLKSAEISVHVGSSSWSVDSFDPGAAHGLNVLNANRAQGGLGALGPRTTQGNAFAGDTRNQLEGSSDDITYAAYARPMGNWSFALYYQRDAAFKGGSSFQAYDDYFADLYESSMENSFRLESIGVSVGFKVGDKLSVGASVRNTSANLTSVQNLDVSFFNNWEFGIAPFGAAGDQRTLGLTYELVPGNLQFVGFPLGTRPSLNQLLGQGSGGLGTGPLTFVVDGANGPTTMTVDLGGISLIDLTRFQTVIEGNDDDLSFNVGFLYNPEGRFSFGATYKRGGSYSFDATTTQLVSFEAGAIDVSLPENFQPGLRTPRLGLLLPGAQPPVLRDTDNLEVVPVNCPDLELFFIGNIDDPSDDLSCAPVVISSSRLKVDIPDVIGVGFGWKPSERLRVGVDVNQITYSDLESARSPLLAALFPGELESIDDAIEVHVGAEYKWFLGSSQRPLSVRAGAYNDPDHDGYRRVKSDDTHFSLGVGYEFKHFQVDLAGETSDALTRGLLSLVYRWGSE